MSGEIGGDRSADAEADRSDALYGVCLQKVIVDYERVREQRLRARPAGAGRIAAVVKRDDLAMRKERMQGKGRRLGVPGVPAEAKPAPIRRPWSEREARSGRKTSQR